MRARGIIPVEQAEQEHALAESRKHAAAGQAHVEAELEAVRVKLAAATEQLEQQRHGNAASLEEERQAAKRKESSMQVMTPFFACSAHSWGREQALCMMLPPQQHMEPRLLYVRP